MEDIIDPSILVEPKNNISDEAWGKKLLDLSDSLKRYSLKLTGNPTEAEDLVQDTIAKALEKKHQFQEGTDFSAWMFTILRNDFYTKTRKSKIRKEVSENFSSASGNTSNSSDSGEEKSTYDFTASDETDALTSMVFKENLDLLELVSPVHQAILRDLAEGEMSYQDLSEKYKVAEGTIKSRVFRAREEFENLIKNRNEQRLVESSNSLASATKNNSVPENYRKVIPFDVSGVKLNKIPLDNVPRIMTVNPRSLLIEQSYQRSLTKKSIRFIRKLIAEWDWSKFKVPNCASDGTNLFIIDGQHTSIAAASHPYISQIPVLVVNNSSLENRAKAFVSLNKNRIGMTPYDIFHAAVASGSPVENELNKVILSVGARVPKSTPGANYWKHGMLSNPNEWIKITKVHGAEKTRELIKLVLATKMVPASRDLIRAFSILMFSKEYECSSKDILKAFRAFPNLENDAKKHSANSKTNTYSSMVILLYDWIYQNCES